MSWASPALSWGRERRSRSVPSASTAMKRVSRGGLASAGVATRTRARERARVIEVRGVYSCAPAFVALVPAVARRLPSPTGGDDVPGAGAGHLRRHRSDGRRVLRELPPLLRAGPQRAAPRPRPQLPRHGGGGPRPPG